MKKIVKNHEVKIVDDCEKLHEFDLINDFEKILSIRKQEKDSIKLAKETQNSAAELREYPMQDFEQEQKSRGFLEKEDAQKDMHRMLYHFIETQFQHGELLQKT